ncbi:hypothetical protein S40293_10916 [Stachybotrys chartarum IBT 40293]|nr:hypothetical protein S40293_10916 [Stachybotrys chartarum IBT 40293]
MEDEPQVYFKLKRLFWLLDGAPIIILKCTNEEGDLARMDDEIRLEVDHLIDEVGRDFDQHIGYFKSCPASEDMDDAEQLNQAMAVSQDSTL